VARFAVDEVGREFALGVCWMRIVPGDFDDPHVIALLRQHLDGMHASSPPGHVFALDLSGLKAPGISFYTAWNGDALFGMGALKQLDPAAGEIKSMRTDPAHLRKGVGAAMLEHLIGIGRERGYRRISLETGSGPAFEAALALYRKRGFVNGGAFADYTESAFSQFLHLDLAARQTETAHRGGTYFGPVDGALVRQAAKSCRRS
jgi:putative acetyltransferase